MDHEPNTSINKKIKLAETSGLSRMRQNTLLSITFEPYLQVFNACISLKFSSIVIRKHLHPVAYPWDGRHGSCHWRHFDGGAELLGKNKNF